MKKVVIIGPESTGKSTLTRQLASHFSCPAVVEVARTYLNQLDRPYMQDDLLEIARGQIAEEDKFSQASAPYMFCDTDLRVIKIWSLFRYGDVHPWISYQITKRTYFCYLLTNIDLPWIPDPLREHELQRGELFDLYQEELQSSGVPFSIISGTDKERVQHAIDFLTDLG